MSKKLVKNFSLTSTELSTGKAFRRSSDTRKTATEYEQAQEAFQKNYERLRAERLAREAAKSNEK
jgi:hypothetical protein